MAELIHRRRPRLVAVSHVPTSSGLVQDVAAVGRACRERGVLYLVDACQSVGQMPVDAVALGCDFLSATARKFLRGPRGAGFLFVSDRVLDEGLEPLFPDLRGADWVAEDVYQPAPDARRFENWEFAYALVLGLGAAARYALDVGLEVARERARALAERTRSGLARLAGVRVLDRGEELSAIVTAHVDGWSGDALVTALRREGIHTSAVTRASAVLDFDDKGVESALRISPHYYNTEDEIDALLEAVARHTGLG
jgi:selenocysteine lyase/cysteine desulfurase